MVLVRVTVRWWQCRIILAVSIGCSVLCISRAKFSRNGLGFRFIQNGRQMKADMRFLTLQSCDKFIRTPFTRYSGAVGAECCVWIGDGGTKHMEIEYGN